ncbi:MAG TPA: WG repeat-containing protein, partial [Chitinophagales bacterium]|nr:WG repeat-containing protein [Chitinophagales bacterium]
MKVISPFAAFFFLAVAVCAQAPIPGSQLYPIRDHGKYGYMSNTGELVIPAMYDNAMFFYEGLAAVKIDGQYGFIDNNNKMVIAPAYDTTGYFSEGWCAVGVMDTASDTPMPMQWSYIDPTGKIMRFSGLTSLGYAHPFHQNRALVTEVGFDEPVFIDKTGATVLKQGTYYFITDPNVHFREGVLKAIKPMGNDGYYKTVFIDTAGALMEGIKTGYDDMGQIVEGMIWFRNGIQYGFLDRSGKEVIEAEYDTVLDFSEGWARVSQRMELNPNTGILEGGIHGYINNLGEWMLQPKARMGYSFKNGYARVFTDGKWGYMNTSG